MRLFLAVSLVFGHRFPIFSLLPGRLFTCRIPFLRFFLSFAALLLGGILWLPIRFRIPNLLLPLFGVRHLPVERLRFPLFFLCFFPFKLFFGHSLVFLADVFLFSAFSWPLVLTCGSPFCSCLWLVHCGLLSRPGRLSLHAILLFVHCLWLVRCGLLLRPSRSSLPAALLFVHCL